jgi:hypothetical protein
MLLRQLKAVFGAVISGFLLANRYAFSGSKLRFYNTDSYLSSEKRLKIKFLHFVHFFISFARLAFSLYF